MSDKVFIIAEAGVNHNGSLDMATALVDVAAHAGADAVKFQTFKADALATAKADRAQYQKENLGEEGDQLSMLRKLELSAAHHEALLKHCKSRGIRFMSTAFDSESLAYLAGLDMPAIKIPSGDITAGPLLLQAAQLRRPLIVSTGMSSLADIEKALGVIAYGLLNDDTPKSTADLESAFFSDAGQAALKQHVTLLHCVTQYPAAPESVNLRAMDTMASAFGLPVGYSDHTQGIDVSLAAVARGASIIEKHFTLDKRLPGPDHLASLEPPDLQQLVQGIRTIERALGSPLKGPTVVEIPNKAVVRRSLVAARPIMAGQTFSPDMLCAKRPATGMSPMAAWDVIGQVALRDYDLDDLIEL